MRSDAIVRGRLVHVHSDFAAKPRDAGIRNVAPERVVVIPPIVDTGLV